MHTLGIFDIVSADIFLMYIIPKKKDNYFSLSCIQIRKKINEIGKLN